MAAKILVIDDDETANELLRFFLESRGYEVLIAQDGQKGLKLADERRPDLILLDVMMPGLDGYELCNRLREVSQVPVIMVTARATEADVIQGFRSGADDYVRKPYSLNELGERIQSILRRVAPTPVSDVYEDERLIIDLGRQLVSVKGKSIALTPTEFRLLKALVENQGRVMSHEELLTLVWGKAYLDAIANLSLYIHYLRDKLEEDPSRPAYILNQWGNGYLFAPKQTLRSH